MRHALLALALLALAPLASAQTEHNVYLHDQGSSGVGRLHLTPPVLNAEVGETLVFTIYNQGATLHNLIVCGDGEKFEATCDDTWGRTRNLDANETALITFEAQKAGRFDYYCDIPGHKGGGMAGTLVVQSEATEKSGIPLGPLALAALGAAAMALRRRVA
jgi:MYXO-CTERM domain-containing protein